MFERKKERRSEGRGGRVCVYDFGRMRRDRDGGGREREKPGVEGVKMWVSQGGVGAVLGEESCQHLTQRKLMR